jgi:hypothetical protein
MSKTAFEQLAAGYADHDAVELSQMFGKPCLKVNGKAFVAWFHAEEMVFKLDEESRTAALKLAGARNWDPSGKGRPMKEWIAVPPAHARRWRALAAKAYEYVAAGS